jgi:hypothetical protein
MPATPRDREKPRQERLREVMQSAQYLEGMTNSQQVIWGLGLKINATHNYDFDIEKGEVYINQELKEIAELKEQTVPAGAETTSAQTCWVLLEVSPAGVLTKTVSAKTEGTPVLPALNAARIAVAYIAIPKSYTVGTTELKTEYFKPIVYSAGNVSPVAGY